MNCFEFQHQLNRQPERLDSAARAHAHGCAGCSRRLAASLEAERAIREAIDVTPPAGLEARILAQHLEQRDGWRWQPPAIAASLAFAVISCVWLWHGAITTAPDLSGEMAEHVLSEPALFIEQAAADEALVNTSIASIGGAVTAKLPVKLVKPCKVPGGDGAHLVFETSAGRAVMTTLPNENEIRQAISEGAVVSAIYRAPRGAYSLVAHNHTAIDLTRALLNSRVDWQI